MYGGEYGVSENVEGGRGRRGVWTRKRGRRKHSYALVSAEARRGNGNRGICKRVRRQRGYCRRPPVGIIGLNTLECPIVETNERPQRNLSFVIGPMSRDHFRPGCCNSDPADWLTFIWPRVGIIGSGLHTSIVRVMHRGEEDFRVGQ